MHPDSLFRFVLGLERDDCYLLSRSLNFFIVATNPLSNGAPGPLFLSSTLIAQALCATANATLGWSGWKERDKGQQDILRCFRIPLELLVESDLRIIFLFCHKHRTQR